jgi:predicted glycogen debranching enzyme
MSGSADNIISIEYSPDSNRNLLQYSVLRIRVKVRQRQLGHSGPFTVVIRTNLNQAGRIRRQVIDLVEKGQSYSTDYYDIPTGYDARGDEYGVDVLLGEVGYFEFKVRVESAQRDRPWVKWADGANVGISVTPLEYGRNNSIYCAFIRQYGSDKDQADLHNEPLETRIITLEAEGAYVLPPGGNFETFKDCLPFIIEQLGMKIIHLLPINPVPTSYGRMGMYGSPYATTDYFGIDHTYGTFSQYKTIEDQFIDLTSTIHGLGAKVFLDMVINHTGWASSILFAHRQWIKVGHDRKIISPGAWGVVWGDLVELDYSHLDLWKYMADMFLTWCGRGIDGFRLDAGYKVPLGVWRYIISRVRQEFPNTMFLLEGLGGPWQTTETLLTEGQSTWAYSELFQNYSRQEIVDYLDYAQRVSGGKGVMVHYAETHDNDRLAKKGRIYTLMRLHLCAFSSFSGAWGFTNGVEWLATEKIDVHRNTALNWGSNDNLVKEITRINKILAENPAFWELGNLEIFNTNNDEVLGFVRSNKDHSNVVACMINLNTQESKKAKWPWWQSRFNEVIKTDSVVCNLLNDQIDELPQDRISQSVLEPGECVVYRLEKKEQPVCPTIPAIFEIDCEAISLIYQILLSRFKPYELGRIDQEKLLRKVTDYRKFIVLVNTVSVEYLIQHDLTEALARIEDDMVERYSSVWTFRESSKEFIISGDKWLVVHTFVPCTAYLKTGRESLRVESIPCQDGVGHLAFFPPRGDNQRAVLSFNWKIERNKKVIRQLQEEEYPVFSLPPGREKLRERKIYPIKLDKEHLHADGATVLLTNGIGGLSQCPARPGVINSKYDTLFAVTPDSSRPEHRLSLIKTTKETIQVGQKFFDLDESFLNSFTRYPQPLWEFIYDDGEYYLIIERSVVMPYGENKLFVRYRIKDASNAITLTSKCYIECRSVHDQMKAAENKELRLWIERSCQTTSTSNGVVFTPWKGMRLMVTAENANFIEQPHWIYGLDCPQDAQWWLQDKSDVFAPGVFNFELVKGDTAIIAIDLALQDSADPRQDEQDERDEQPTRKDLLLRSIRTAETSQNKRVKNLLAQLPVEKAQKDPLVKMLTYAMDQFLVHLNNEWQIIAGYPWLGVRVRDSLHCVNGLLAVGRQDVARDVIMQAARTESNGLLADWLGTATDQRTSTEASLRLFLAGQNYVKHISAGDDTPFWDKDLGIKRSLREILASIYESFRQGKGNGPMIDQSSGLLYSPSGFSWMNTSYPCATPRGGFPIEIQALWFQVLAVLAEVCPAYATQAQQMRKQIAEKFISLYWNEKRGYLADVLIAQKHTAAEKALADTSLRFNQLEAINAGLVPLDQARQVIDLITRRLLVPAAVRSLSEDPLAVPLKIVDDRGILLADPRMPYQGTCSGNETTRRVAYHNGTAWLNAYPGFIEARASVFRFTDLAVRQALAFFEPIRAHLVENGIGTISEMKDGNYPHHARGCYGYALGVAEALRVYMLLKYQQRPMQLAKKEFSTTAQTQQ